MDQQNGTKKILIIAVAAFLLLGALSWGGLVVLSARFFGDKDTAKDAGAKAKYETVESAALPEVLGEAKEETEVSESAEQAEEVPELNLQSVEPDEGLFGNAEDTDEAKKPGKTKDSAHVSTEPDPMNFFAITVGDTTYQLPQKVSDFLEDGWTFPDGEDSEVLGSKEYISCELRYPGTRADAYVYITNYSLDSKTADECYVTRITFYADRADEMGVSVTAHGGDIVFPTGTAEDVKKAWGEPDYVTDDCLFFYGSTYDDYYTDDDMVYVNIADDGTLEYYSIATETEPEDLDEAEVSDETPAYLAKYQAPGSLGDDPLSGNFQLDGVVYSVPVPLKVLTDNGWKHEYDESSVCGAGLEYSIALERGKERIYVTVGNFDDKACMLKNTIVTEVTVYGTDANMELPCGLKNDVTQKELLAFMKKNGIDNYDFYDNTKSYKIPFDQTGKDRKQANNRYDVVFGYTDSDDTVPEWFSVRSYGWINE